MFLKNMIVFFSLVMSNFYVMIANNLIRSDQNMRFKNYQDTISCKRNNCEIACFFNPLLDLLDDDYHLDEKKFCVAHCLQNKKFFDILLKGV